ncbi:MAG: hypothetical protein ACKVHP_07415 [Verrucomicrobiales bacterium]
MKSHQDSLYEEIIQAEFTPERRPELRWILAWSDCFGYQSSASLKRDAVSDIICREAFIDSALIAAKVSQGKAFRESTMFPGFYAELQRWAIPSKIPKRSCWGDYLSSLIRSSGSRDVILRYIDAVTRLEALAEGKDAIELYVAKLKRPSRDVVNAAIRAISRRPILEGATSVEWVRERWMALALWDCSPREGWNRVEKAIEQINEQKKLIEQINEQKKLMEAEPAGQQELSEPILLVDPFEDSTTFPVKQPPRATSSRLPSPIAASQAAPQVGVQKLNPR